MANSFIRYTYRLRPMSAETTLTLEPGGLRAERADRNFTVQYRDINAIWLSFMPRGAAITGYRTKIYLRDRKTITLDDTSYTSFFVQERQGDSYRAFVLELIARVKKANPDSPIMGGRTFWVQAATALFGLVFGMVLPVFAFMTIWQGQWPTGVMFAAFCAVFVWWTWRFVRTNRLRNIGRDGIPADLLPPAGS